MLEPGTKVTVTRGKAERRGQEVEILSAADPKGNYPVRYSDGTVAVINSASLRAPAEGTVTAGNLASEIQTTAADHSDSREVQQALTRLVTRLDHYVPGLAARIQWPIVDEDADPDQR